jgi:tripeptide aminopeptidase
MLPPQYANIEAAAAALKEQREKLAALCIAVQQIAAPTDQEQERAAWVQGEFQRLGLADVSMDELHNVYARIPGREPSRPALLVSAHTDTVFPAHTDLSIRIDNEEGRIYGPGIGDNSTGVAALLALAESLSTLGAPPVDVWLVANSGEEGLGDLRGMRAAVDRLRAHIGAAIVLEGMGLGRIVHRALGSRRYRITATAPGGHSWSDFGTASAVHVLALIAADIVRVKVPASPRTTFNIGRIEGGTSINTIAQHATMELDMRSEEPVALEYLAANVDQLLERYQSARWKKWGVHVTVETIGDRPAGELAADHPLVKAAAAALVDAGLTAPPDLRISSTDANIPLSRGIPAVCVGIAEGGNAHRLEEWLSTAKLGQGMQHLFLLTWWAAAWLAGEVG